MFNSVQQVDNIVKKTISYILNNSEKEDLSELWEKTLSSRENVLDTQQILTFIKDFNNTGTGLDIKLKDKLNSFHKRVVGYTDLHGVDPDFIKSIEEPSFGIPYLFLYDDYLISSSYLRNMLNAYNIFKIYQNKRRLNVLEIGPGTGHLASILLQKLDIKNYVLLDISENLALSTAFVNLQQSTDPIFVDNEINQSSLSNDLNIISCLPNKLNKIKLDFDLVINTNSMGEMKKCE